MVQPESDHRRPEQPNQRLNPQPPAAPQTTELDRQSAELAAMRRVLSASRGTFSLSVATCNSPALRDYLIGRLSTESPGIQVLTLPADIDDVFDQVRAKSPPAGRTALFLVNLEASLRSDQTEHPVLRALNASREPWRSSFACPVVFWLPEFATTLLSVHARDFWAWCSHRFEFVSEDGVLAGRSTENFSAAIASAANLDVDRKHFRIAELERRLDEAGNNPPTELGVHVANWLNELGFLRISLGDIVKAESMFSRALEKYQQLGSLEGIAGEYGNLGLVHRTRGDLDEAERMLRKSLEINEKLGRLEGMADQYGNLAVIHKTRGDLVGAERMLGTALEINEKLGRLAGMASDYGNLAEIHRIRGELDKAERTLRKALEIDDKLGQLDRMAGDYGNLGAIHNTRGDLDEAELMYRKALDIAEKLGRPEGMAIQYANLGLIHLRRGDLQDAELMVRQALEISEKLGLMEGIANQYGLLGVIYQTRADPNEAERLFRRSLEINEKLGRLMGMADQHGNLGTVAKSRGDIAATREHWTKCRDLFRQIGIPHKVEELQALLDELPAEDT